MKANNEKKNKAFGLLLVDALLLGGFWLANQVRLTGMAFHEWFGLALGLVLALHLGMHWRWVVNTLRNFFRRSGWTARLKLVLDMVGLAAFAAILVSGMLMSRSVLPALGLHGLHSHALKAIHVSATNLTLAMIAGHLLLNIGTLFKLLRCLLPGQRKALRREAL
ncbi:MAG: hypothetical protein PWQ55_2559 [Chloroflexota bacterium]|nr:hypothetical protein [Chloroflexota bacterium]